MSGESLVEEFEDLFLLLLTGVSTDSATKCLKITWPRRTAYPRCYSSALRMIKKKSLVLLRLEIG